MVLVCALMRIVGGEKRAPAVFLTFILMRVIQVFFNVLESCALRSGSKGIRIGLFLLFLVIYIAMQSHMSYFLLDIYDLKAMPKIQRISNPTDPLRSS